MKKGRGSREGQVFEFIRENDDENSKFSDQRGLRILEKLIRQDPQNSQGLERAHAYLEGDPNLTSAMHAAASAMRTNKIRVFISYRLNSDSAVTRAIANVFDTLSDRIEVTSAENFTVKNVGQDYREEIQHADGEAHWFIIILSDPRRTSAWSMYETGMFRASMVSKRMNRLICIHHPLAKPPDQIYEFHAVSADYEEMSAFLSGIFCQPNPLPGWEALRSDIGPDVIASSAKQIVDAFKAPSRPFEFNRWVKLTVRPNQNLDSWSDLSDCPIETDSRALELFGKSRAPETWGALVKNVVREQAQNKWLEELYAVIVKAIAEDDFRPISGTFECAHGGRVMRPILHSMETDGSGGTFTFNIYFIDDIYTAPARMLPAGVRTLLTALRMSDRIRWEVLERFRDTEWNQNQIAVCTIAFSRIEREGLLFGGRDLEALYANYGEAVRDEVRSLVNRWHEIKGFSPGTGAFIEGELDAAFEAFDPARIDELMVECRELINRFLRLTYPVLEEVLHA